jgi:glycolate oxidase FAD binding subunit
MGQPETPEIRYVATPHSLDELCELMATAHQRGLVVVPRGSGSKFGWLDLPPVIDVLLDMSAFSSCRFDREAGEVTVGAGAAVATVQDELAKVGRRAPLDPPSLRATVGGTFVTAETGPLAHHFGPPAAHVVDATIALPDGTLSTVADTVKLLGNCVCDLRWAYPGHPNHASVVAEIVLRTQALPEVQTWVTCPVSQPMHISDLLAQISEAGVAPAAIELDLPGLRPGAAMPGKRVASGAVSVLIEGSVVSVLERSRRLGESLTVDSNASAQMPPWWGRYPFRPADVAVRLNAPDGQLHLVSYALSDAAGMPIPVRGSLGGGPGWAALPGDLSAQRLTTILDTVREVLLARGGSAVVQAVPSELREVLTPYRRP